MKIYVMTDSHLGHQKLTDWGHRPEGFTNDILDGLRHRQADLLIHLGDVCIGKDEYYHNTLAECAKGFKQRVLVKGNHDQKSYGWYLSHGWDFVTYSYSARYFGKHILFTHMPAYGHLQAPHFNYDLNLHGHLHGDGVRRKAGLSREHRDTPEERALYDLDYHIDAAPDLHGYQPINLEKLIHHGNRNFTN